MSKFHAVQYTLPNGRKVFLTNRPDRVEGTDFDGFVTKNAIPVRFAFTDDYPADPQCILFRPDLMWFPWVPGKKLPPENAFAFISAMSRYDSGFSPHASIWLHCDSSSMRAPTLFGLFLKCLYPEQAEVISDAGRVVEGTREHLSHPHTYSNTSLAVDPGIKELVTAWVSGGEDAAHATIFRGPGEL